MAFRGMFDEFRKRRQAGAGSAGTHSRGRTLLSVLRDRFKRKRVNPANGFEHLDPRAGNESPSPADEREAARAEAAASQRRPSRRERDYDSEDSPRASLLAFLSGLGIWFQIKAAPVLRRVDWDLIRTSALILALSFVFASSVSTFAAHSALNFAVANRNKKGTAGEEVLTAPAVAGGGGPSASELRKLILDRNVFNSEGKLAPEASVGEGGVQKTKDLDFDAVPCTEEKLPVEVVGTIYTGNPLTGFVSVKDAKVADTDTYKHGDVIIEHEDYEIHAVRRGKVEFRKGDTKICVTIKGFEEGRRDASASPSPPVAPGSVRPENVENLEFDTAYVQQEIGPGYANILNSAKLIPEVEPSGTTAGYKIIAITPGSLFDKMKLMNGDVITEVNGVSLRDASQGFKMYQALQEEREITVNLTRGGEPMVRKVRVK